MRNPFSAKCMWCETAHQLYLHRSVRIGSRLRCSCSFRAGSSFTQLTSPWNLEACSPQLPLLKAAWHACPSCSLLQDGIGWSNKTTSANTPGFLPHHSDLQQPSPGALPHLTVQCREFSLKSPLCALIFQPEFTKSTLLHRHWGSTCKQARLPLCKTKLPDKYSVDLQNNQLCWSFCCQCCVLH